MKKFIFLVAFVLLLFKGKPNAADFDIIPFSTNWPPSLTFNSSVSTGVDEINLIAGSYNLTMYASEETPAYFALTFNTLKDAFSRPYTLNKITVWYDNGRITSVMIVPN